MLRSAWTGASSTRYFAISKCLSAHAICSGVFPYISRELTVVLSTRILTKLRLPELHAVWITLLLLPSKRLGSAPLLLTRKSAILISSAVTGHLQTMCNAVSPSIVRTLTSQLLLTNFTTSVEFWPQAMWRGNSPSLFWIVWSHWHCSVKNCMTSISLCSQAMCSGVSPRFVWALQPYLLTNFTTSRGFVWALQSQLLHIFTEFCLQAMWRGNSPSLFWIVWSHWHCSVKNCITSISLRSQAMCSGVSPHFVWALQSQLFTNFTTSREFCLQAMWRDNSPSLFWIVWSHWHCSVKNCMTSISLYLQAMCSGVSPSFVWALQSQLLTIFTTSREFWLQAMWRGSSPFIFWIVWSHWHCLVRNSTTSKEISSCLQTTCNGVLPNIVWALTSQLLTSFTISRGLLHSQAMCSGNSPGWFLIFWLHFLSSVRNFTISKHFLMQTIWSGVLPCASEEFTMSALVLSSLANSKLPSSQALSNRDMTLAGS